MPTNNSASPTSLKIAVLDDYHHLADRHLAALDGNTDITIYHDTLLPTPDPTPLLERLRPYNVLVTMRERTPLPASVIDQLPNLKIILTTGMRNRGIDMDAAKAKGMIVAGTPVHPLPQGLPKDFAATVQHTWALILALVNNIPRDNSFLPAGQWNHALPLNTYIGGKTIGLLGLGRLGAGVARIAKLAFGMRVIAWSENLTQDKADDAAREAGLQAGDYQVVTKQELLEQSDILSIHVIFSERTRGILSTSELALLKPTAFIINTSRGPLIDEDALLTTLEKGKIRGAALDVFDVEPLALDSRWRTTKWGEEGRSQVVLTPHTGYAFEDHMNDMWISTAENLGRLLRKEELEWRIV